MRVRVIAAAVVALVGRPCLRPVDRRDRSTDVDSADGDVHGFARDVQADSPALVVAGPHVTDGRYGDDGRSGGDQPHRPTTAWRSASATLRSACAPTRSVVPGPGEGYGDLRVSGMADDPGDRRVQRAGRRSTSACDSIETGDFLEPYVETAAADHGHRRRSDAGLQRSRQRPVRHRQPRAVRRRRRVLDRSRHGARRRRRPALRDLSRLPQQPAAGLHG